MKSAAPEEVAEAIVRALKFPRRDVFVPREVGPLHKSTYVLPIRAQEAVSRVMRSDRVLQDIDHHQRAAYENRAAHSEPGMEPEAVGEGEPVETS